MPAKRTAKTIATSFGIELKSARTTRQLTQQVLAERADVDPVFVSFLENGHRQPSLTVLLAVESVLGLQPGELARRTAQRVSQATEAKPRTPNSVGSKRAAKRPRKTRT